MYFVCILQPGNNFSAVLACFLSPSCVWFWENTSILKLKMKQGVTPILLWVELIKREKTKWRESCSVVSNSLWSHGIYSPWNSPGQNTGVGSLSLLQGIISTQGLNPCLLHWGQILYQLSHKGNPRILEWVAYPFSSGSFQSRNRTGVSRIASGFFTNWTIMEAPKGEEIKSKPHDLFWRG